MLKLTEFEQFVLTSMHFLFEYVTHRNKSLETLLEPVEFYRNVQDIINPHDQKITRYKKRCQELDAEESDVEEDIPFDITLTYLFITLF